MHAGAPSGLTATRAAPEWLPGVGCCLPRLTRPPHGWTATGAQRALQTLLIHSLTLNKKRIGVHAPGLVLICSGSPSKLNVLWKTSAARPSNAGEVGHGGRAPRA